MWLYVSLDYATFAVGASDGKTVDEATPIAKWALGKPIKQVADYYRNKGADILERETP